MALNEEYRKRILGYMLRHKVKPGITGLAQVRQGYDQCIEDVRSKVGYDHAYALALTRIGSWLAMDASIALHTLRVMVGRKGQ